MESSFICDGARGVRLHGRRWKLENPVATVAGVHGYSEHSGRYAHLAQFLNQQGYDVFWIDLPGHGLSEGRRADVVEFSDYVIAIEKLIQEVERHQAKLPIHLFSHSLGALAGIRFLETSSLANKIKSTILSGPLLGLSHYSPKLLPLLEMIGWLLPNFSVSNKSELGNNVLTHDQAITRSRIDDKLVNSVVTIRWVREFIRARSKAFSQIEKIQLPTLILKAELEKVVDPHEISRFFELLKNSDKELKVYKGMLHEVVNEVDRAQVFADILGWLKRHP